MNHTNPSSSLARRSFLKGALAAGTATTLAPRLLFGAKVSPNGKVNLACIGIGNRGEQVISEFAKTGLANIVALCDTDLGAPHTQGTLKKHPDAKQFQDFRVMFDKIGKEFDAVCICTPDFSHFPIAMHAMAHGKHVYVEKPLGRTFRENQLLMAAEEKFKVATQMGNQGHSEANYFQFKAWTEAGIIKDVTKITAFMNSPRRWHGETAETLLAKGKAPVPDTLDWDLWLSQTKEREYNKNYVNGQWRSWYDFGMGALGDWGAHIFDTAHEFLKLGLPEEVVPVTLEGHSDLIFPQASTLLFKFAAREGMPACEMTWLDGAKNRPSLPDKFGQPVADSDIPPPSTGKIDKAMPPGKVIYGKDLTFKGGSHGSTLRIIPEDKENDIKASLPEIPKSPSNHFANFLNAAKGVETCRSRFAISAPLSQVMNLGVLAQWLNRPIKFDQASGKVVGDDKATALLVGPPPRKDWEQYYKL